MTITDDNYSASGASNPVANGVAVVPHASTNFTTRSRYLYVGGAGTLAIVMAGDEGDAVVTITITAATVGIMLPIRAIRINAIGTTATLIVAFF